MHSYHLGREEVLGYLRDFAAHLSALGRNMPTFWCAINKPGMVLAQALLGQIKTLGAEQWGNVDLLAVSYDRAERTIEFSGGKIADIRKAKVLVLDGYVLSGRTMIEVLQAIRAHEPDSIYTYSLILKRGSKTVPNCFGLIVEDEDIVFYFLNQLPNYRLMTSGCVRRLEPSDQKQPPVRTGEPTLDKWTWGDFLYDLATDKTRQTYVYDDLKRVLGYMSFKISRRKALLDTIGVDESAQHRGIATSLLNWLEVCCRQAGCRYISLWSLPNRVTFYENNGYELVRGREMRLERTAYRLMRKAVSYDWLSDLKLVWSQPEPPS